MYFVACNSFVAVCCSARCMITLSRKSLEPLLMLWFAEKIDRAMGES